MGHILADHHTWEYLGFILVVGLNISLYYQANKRMNQAVEQIVKKGETGK